MANESDNRFWKCARQMHKYYVYYFTSTVRQCMATYCTALVMFGQGIHTDNDIAIVDLHVPTQPLMCRCMLQLLQ